MLGSFGGANCAVASCPFPTILSLAPELREKMWSKDGPFTAETERPVALWMIL